MIPEIIYLFYFFNQLKIDIMKWNLYYHIATKSLPCDLLGCVLLRLEKKKKRFIDSVKCCLIINGIMLFDLDILIGNLEIIEIKFDMIPIPSKTLDIEDVAQKKSYLKRWFRDKGCFPFLTFLLLFPFFSFLAFVLMLLEK